MSVIFNKENVETLKKSSRAIGFLQPTIREEGTNRILVGRHRKFADPNWPEKQIEVKDDLHRELIILNGNIQRVISREETKMRFLRIAKILEAKGVVKHRVCAEMAKLEGMPYTQRWIEQLLPKEYKMKTVPQNQKSRTTSTSPEKQESRTILDSVTSKVSPDETIFPFPDCKCKTCPHRNECY